MAATHDPRRDFEPEIPAPDDWAAMSRSVVMLSSVEQDSRVVDEAGQLRPKT